MNCITGRCTQLTFSFCMPPLWVAIYFGRTWRWRPPDWSVIHLSLREGPVDGWKLFWSSPCGGEKILTALMAALD